MESESSLVYRVSLQDSLGFTEKLCLKKTKESGASLCTAVFHLFHRGI